MSTMTRKTEDDDTKSVSSFLRALRNFGRSHGFYPGKVKKLRSENTECYNTSDNVY